jgi:hypothetical protein
VLNLCKIRKLKQKWAKYSIFIEIYIKIDFFWKYRKNLKKLKNFEKKGSKIESELKWARTFYILFRNEKSAVMRLHWLVLFECSFRPTFDPRKRLGRMGLWKLKSPKISKNYRKMLKNHKKMKILQKIKKNCKKTWKKRNFC